RDPRDHLLGRRGPGAALADPLDPHPRLRAGREARRREAAPDHRRRDPAEPAAGDVQRLRVRPDHRDPRRGGAELHRLRRGGHPDLGLDAVLRPERPGAHPGRLVVVRAAGRDDRAAGLRPVPDQLLDRRDHQPPPAHRPEGGPHRAPGRERRRVHHRDRGGPRMSTPMTGPVPPDHPDHDAEQTLDADSVLAREEAGGLLVDGSLEEGRLGGAASPVLEEPVLSVRDLNIVYEVGEGVHAVKDASFTLRRGEILGLAGESGCGKTTLAYGLNQLHRPPARITSGAVTFHDRTDGSEVDVLALEGAALRTFRWSKVAMVFQGAMNSLNPVLNVRAQLADVLTTHRPQMDRAERRRRGEELLELVGVERSRIDAFPHELSGGMRQRVMIAMALALDPQLMIMDEPTTALDVVVQREILQEVLRLRKELGFAVV